MTQVLIKPVPVENLSPTEVLPVYAKPGDAGMDGRANIKVAICVLPGERVLIPLGIQVAIPEGYEIQVRPRSGLALKDGISLCNAIGTIDAGFRNELGAIIINHGNDPFLIQPGDRICQLVLNKFETIHWYIVEELPPSERGMGGFGHTGVNSEA